MESEFSLEYDIEFMIIKNDTKKKNDTKRRRRATLVL